MEIMKVSSGTYTKLTKAGTTSHLWAVFITKLFLFRDDVELRLDTDEGLIHIRSSSRVGYSDLGQNRKRVNIIQEAFKKGDIGIFGAGGALDFNTSEKEIFETLKKGNDKIKGTKKKIMVTHMHAKGTKSEISGFEGSKSIRKAIEKFKPQFLLHSHIHEAEGIEEMIGQTKVINVGRKGKIIEI